ILEFLLQVAGVGWPHDPLKPGPEETYLDGVLDRFAEAGMNSEPQGDLRMGEDLTLRRPWRIEERSRGARWANPRRG
ncbi:MAG: hypothetical protein O2816_19155, partial [Planctomycetota bacterium]|nr:hypothetical protein [Planctomycetota bacterium]